MVKLSTLILEKFGDAEKAKWIKQYGDRIDPKTIDKYIVYEDKILDMFNNNNVEKYINDSELFFWCGNYYNTQEKYDKMEKYYLMAINNNHVNSMFNLAMYYTKINPTLMKKYYLLLLKICFIMKILIMILFLTTIHYFMM